MIRRSVARQLARQQWAGDDLSTWSRGAYHVPPASTSRRGTSAPAFQCLCGAFRFRAPRWRSAERARCCGQRGSCKVSACSVLKWLARPLGRICDPQSALPALRGLSSARTERSSTSSLIRSAWVCSIRRYTAQAQICATTAAETGPTMSPWKSVRGVIPCPSKASVA